MQQCKRLTWRTLTTQFTFKSSFTFTKTLQYIDKLFSSAFLRCQLTNKSKCDNLSRMMMTIQWVVNIQHAFLWHYTTHKIDNGPSRKMGIVLNVKICFYSAFDLIIVQKIIFKQNMCSNFHLTKPSSLNKHMLLSVELFIINTQV